MERLLEGPEWPVWSCLETQNVWHPVPSTWASWACWEAGLPTSCLGLCLVLIQGGDAAAGLWEHLRLLRKELLSAGGVDPPVASLQLSSLRAPG